MATREEIEKEIRKLNDKYSKTENDIARMEEDGIYDDFNYNLLDQLSEQIDDLKAELEAMEE
jgi:hypothetical protein